MAFPRFRSPYGTPESFPSAHPRFVSPYGIAAPRMRVGRVRQRGMSGLGIVTPIVKAGGFPTACPAWGCNGPAPIAIWNSGSVTTAGGSAAGSSVASAPAATSGTPVPSGYPTDQIFMAPDGSQWVYSSSQGTWLNVGTPYNLSAASNPPAASTSMPSTPTVGSTYTDASGNIWTFNGTTWTITGNTLTAALTSTAAAAASVPASPTVGQTYTDASGNIYTWNGAAWSLTTAAGTSATSDYSSVLDFLTQDNLITGVPNWVVGAGLVGAYLVLSSKMGGKR